MPIAYVPDQGVPRDAAVALRDLGSECIHVGAVGRSTAADEEILRFALAKGAVVVTLDAGFHAILAVSGAVRPSVIRIRIQGPRAAEIAACVRSVSARFTGELEAGSLVTVRTRKTTCHMLPIGLR